MVGRIITVFLALIILFPLLYCLSASFFSPIDFTSEKARFLPSEFSFTNYISALSHRWYPRYIFNSLITSVLLTVLRLFVSISAAFALSHFDFFGKKAFTIFILVTLFVPQDALLIENYRAISAAGLTNTYIGMILPSVFTASSIMLLTGAFKAAGKELYLSAVSDGASDFIYISEILIPETISIVSVIAIQAFITTFNNYLWPLLVTTKTSMRTVQVGLSMLGFSDSANKGAEAASIIIVVLPLLLLSFAAKKITDGAVSRGVFK